MRRKEQEITDRDIIDAIMARAPVCRIGLCDQGVPYVVPVTFGYRHNRLYFHSSAEGRKMEILRANPNVCFQVDVDVKIVPADTACNWTVHYYSAIGDGTASIVEDLEEKIQGLNLIMEHYSGESHHDYPEALVHKAALVRIDISTVTGKKSGY